MTRRHLARAAAVIAIALTTATALTACGRTVDPGATVTQKRDVSGASAVVLAGSGRLDIALGSTPSLVVTAGENVIDNVTSTVDGDVLVLDVRDRSLRLTSITYRLVLPSVDGITVSGAGSVHAKLGPASSLKVDLAGAGEITVGGVRLTDLDVAVSGAGGVTLAGDADRQRVVISGLGRYDGEALSSRDADVLVSGAGGADVQVSETLLATVTGAGSITYAGSAEVTSSVTGVGSVRERE